MTKIDHITITAPSLEVGAKLVEDALGIAPQKGGEHPRMGTHNLFLHLGDSVFLEVIAINPKAQKLDRSRWFALDRLSQDALPALRTWVINTNNIQKSLENAAQPLGVIEPMSRGETNWLITIPKDGSLPVDGVGPALIEWQVEEHPAAKLTDQGLTLLKLEIHHPEPEKLSSLFSSLALKDDVAIIQSDVTKLVAFINTPTGVRTL